MVERNLAQEQRKTRILVYLIKNPLSTARKIADNYHKTEHNFEVVKRDITELYEQGKIGKIFDSREYYFINPHTDEGKRILVSIMKSYKIFERRFTKIPYDDDIHLNKPIFPQIVAKCINLFHLRFKIMLIEKRRKSKTVLTIKQTRNLQKAFQKYFINFLLDYSIKKYSVFAYSISKKGSKSFIESKNPTQENLLVFLSNYIDARYHHDKLYFEQLTSGKIPLKEKLDLMSVWILTGNKRNAADVQGTTNKNIQRILQSVMYDDGGYSLEKAAALQQTEEGRLMLPKVSSFDTSKVFWELLVRKMKPLLKTAKGRRKISKESKKRLRFDLLKVVDWKSIDIS